MSSPLPPKEKSVEELIASATKTEIETLRRELERELEHFENLIVVIETPSKISGCICPIKCEQFWENDGNCNCEDCELRKNCEDCKGVLDYSHDRVTEIEALLQSVVQRQESLT